MARTLGTYAAGRAARTMGAVTVPDASAHDAELIDLLVASGLVTGEEVAAAARLGRALSEHVDETLIASGMVDADRLRRVMSHAWSFPVIDLSSEWIDDELVRSWESKTYLSERWMPVRDQANGSVLVATARIPDSARIEELLLSPVEFAVTTSTDIREAVLWSFTGERSGAFQGSFSRVISRLRRPWSAIS